MRNVKNWIVAGILLILTIYAFYFYQVQHTRLMELENSMMSWLVNNPTQSEYDYYTFLADYKGWDYKAGLCLYAICSLDAVMLLILFNLKKALLFDFLRKKLEKSYAELPAEQQSKITDRVYCKNCKTYHKMNWIREE